MSPPEPFAVPLGWRRSRRGGVLVATRPGPAPARLEWRSGSPPAYDAQVVEDEDAFDLAGRARSTTAGSDTGRVVSSWSARSGPGASTASGGR